MNSLAVGLILGVFYLTERGGFKMLNKVKRLVAGMLAVVTMITATPIMNVNAASDGAKEKASLESLGYLGTVNIGSKSESGNWLKTQISGRDVFCLDLGKACHTGYTYVASNSTITSDVKCYTKVVTGVANKIY